MENNKILIAENRNEQSESSKVSPSAGGGDLEGPLKVAIIGVGLIGGSMAIVLREKNVATSIIGVDANIMHQEKALELGLVDKISDLDDAVNEADIIILSVPVDVANRLLPQI